MGRKLTPEFVEEMEKTVKQIVVFYEGEFTSGIINLWSGLGEIEWDDKTWTGVGTIASISKIEETSEIKANGIQLSLNGIPSSNLSLILSETGQGREGKIWIGFLDDDGVIVTDPSLAFIGRMDVPAIKDDGKTLVISISYENRLRDLERSRETRYTDQSQKLNHPGDRGFEYVTALQEWSGLWGQT